MVVIVLPLLVSLKVYCLLFNVLFIAFLFMSATFFIVLYLCKFVNTFFNFFKVFCRFLKVQNNKLVITFFQIDVYNFY